MHYVRHLLINITDHNLSPHLVISEVGEVGIGLINIETQDKRDTQL